MESFVEDSVSPKFLGQGNGVKIGDNDNIITSFSEKALMQYDFPY